MNNSETDIPTAKLLSTLVRLRAYDSIDFADEQMLNEEITLVEQELRSCRSAGWIAASAYLTERIGKAYDNDDLELQQILCDARCAMRYEWENLQD